MHWPWKSYFLQAIFLVTTNKSRLFLGCFWPCNHQEWFMNFALFKTQPIYPLRAFCKDMPSILKGALRLNSVIWKLFRYVKKVLLCDLPWHPKSNSCNAQEVIIKKSFYTSRHSHSSLLVFVRLRDFYY